MSMDSSKIQQRTKQFQELTREISTKADSIEPEKLNKVIMKLPVEKAKAAQDVAEAFINKKMSEKNAKATRAQKMLFASKMKTQKGLSNAEDRRAFVDNDQEVQEAEATLIEFEAEYTSAKLYYDVLEDMFIACRKVLGYIAEKEKAERDYNRYVDESRRNG